MKKELLYALGGAISGYGLQKLMQPKPITEQEAETFVNQWIDTINIEYTSDSLTEHSNEVVDGFYTSGVGQSPILVSTIGETIFLGVDQIKEYFQTFLALNPLGSLTSFNFQSINGIGVASGTYSFAMGDGSIVDARFTYVLIRDANANNSIRILNHHSSAQPV